MGWHGQPGYLVFVATHILRACSSQVDNERGGSEERGPRVDGGDGTGLRVEYL